VVYCPTGPALSWMLPWGALPGPLTVEEREELERRQEERHRQLEEELGASVEGYASQVLGELRQESSYLQLAEFPDTVSTKVWEGALLLRERLLGHKESWAGVRVLELGAGVGLVGLALAALGAQAVLTDLGNAMGVLDANVQRNVEVVSAAGGSARAIELDWLWDEERQRAMVPLDRFDFILGADIVYEHQCIEPLLQTALRFGNEIWLLQNIHRAGSEMFLELARAQGLLVHRQHLVDKYELWQVRKAREEI